MAEALLRAWDPAARAGSDYWGLPLQPLLHDLPARASDARRRGDARSGRPDRPTRLEDPRGRALPGW